MTDAIVAQLDKEIATTETRLAALRTARAALSEGAGPDARPAKAATPQKRAPQGHLEQAIKAALAGNTKGLPNGDLRAKLAKEGYAFSLTPLHVGKTLTRMVGDKELVADKSGTRPVYRVAK